MEPQPVNNQPDFAESTPKDSFTNFSEISYGKTRSSYDQSEIAVKQQTFRAAHQWRAAIREASPARPNSPSLIWATAVSRTTPTIVSETGPRETNETKISYETLRHSYKQCLTQHPNRIWEGQSAETPGLNSPAKSYLAGPILRHLVSTPLPNPVRHLYSTHRLSLPSRASEFVPPPALPA